MSGLGALVNRNSPEFYRSKQHPSERKPNSSELGQMTGGTRGGSLRVRIIAYDHSLGILHPYSCVISRNPLMRN
ncbi:hypothetical protein Hdeb2414_s0006g00201871 [Helianthus debilis subsp. tardiflorus]